ncbi:hypothetical protein DFH07DRAFT_777760 [Mycena maculata]|uniref:Uncharacterized protein n=1 Tax=Mycena maculata TaxID=230809 RepID=A0AAD7N1I8_9AGAR|nr:hypothetical protein DFH07DRAFT_777760 [Mycena maculata]
MRHRNEENLGVPKWEGTDRISTSRLKLICPVLTIKNVLASMLAEEEQKLTHEDGHKARTPGTKWIHNGMNIECQQVFIIMLLENHRVHPLQETWTTITKLRDTLNINLKTFRESQRGIYPHLKLSALDVDELELTAI